MYTYNHKDPLADLIGAEREVDSAHLHQLAVCALLDDNALVKAGDLVGVPNRRQTMRDHDCRPALARLIINMFQSDMLLLNLPCVCLL